MKDEFYDNALEVIMDRYELEDFDEETSDLHMLKSCI